MSDAPRDRGSPRSALSNRRTARGLAKPLAALGLLLVGSIVFGLAGGYRWISLSTVFDALFADALELANLQSDGGTAGEYLVVRHRWPRVLLMALVGASLAPAGAAYQGLFRNPLADPYIVGVASGAGLGATLVIVWLPSTTHALSPFAIPTGAFLGGLVAVTIVVAIARTSTGLPPATTLLAGIAVGTFATALTSFLMMSEAESLDRVIVSCLSGGVSAAAWAPIGIVAGYSAVGFVGLLFCGRALNVLQLGEESASQLGVRVERVKVVVLASATLMTAAAVSFGGLLGFVGLVVPHILRLLSGSDYRRLIPMSALAGATFLVLVDAASRSFFGPREYPVGLWTALVGGPFFVFLLVRGRRRWQ